MHKLLHLHALVFEGGLLIHALPVSCCIDHRSMFISNALLTPSLAT